jgi:predicted DNA binding CopG/RHH family protein
MKRTVDFSKGKKNPYASKLKRSITIRLDGFTVDYFKSLAAELDLPYQTLINLYLRECAGAGRRLAMEWRPSKRERGAA